ncbi:FadR/GntR family transcriptional regulator [Acidisoma sp.]|uniref:FadR/GntR family transcriptional regulator n=1 Tax=Acidisoma sp. TaxID=1872115 RepID=UPI003B00305F
MGPIETQTRDQAVLKALAAFTASVSLQPGERLPTERMLAEKLAVSRGTIREALKRWESLGIVSMRKGSGTYLLRSISPDSLHLPLTLDGSDLPSLLHMLEVRRALEAEAAAICAERASAAQIAVIRARLEAMEPVFFGDVTISAEADWAFHRSIIETASNPLITQMLDAMRDLMHRFWEQPLGITDFGHASFPFHRTVVEAIARGDAGEARQETLKLLETVRGDLLRGATKGEANV